MDYSQDIGPLFALTQTDKLDFESQVNSGTVSNRKELLDIGFNV